MNKRELILNNKADFRLEPFLSSGAVMATQDDRVLVGVSMNATSRRALELPSLYAPDFFFREEKPWVVFERVFSFTKAELKSLLAGASAAPWDVRGEEPPSREGFEEAFDRIFEGFQSGRYKKVVPYAVSYLDASTGPAQIAYALCRLMDLPSEFTPYGLWSAKEGILGATPELLFKKEGRTVDSMAIAGTRKQNSDEAPLIEDEKQLHEHRVVVESVQSVLEAFGEVETSPMEIQTLRYLEHLRTKIRAITPKEASFEELVKALHPTPALGANPKGSANDLFEAMDRVLPRRRFGAPFGWCLPSGDGICTVAIRNVQWNEGKVALAAGCGVVPASRFDDEWNELQAKMYSIRKILGLPE